MIPEHYRGREQSFLKHRVLQEYLTEWGVKIGSLARKRRVRLWYVDCFAGPWKSQSQSLEDTSIHIGLSALEDAAKVWATHGEISASAIFVEKERAAYQQLTRYLHERKGSISATALYGEFGQHVSDLERRLGTDPAFVFVDPTGFKGVAMRYIERLVRARMRDVMVNVMFNDINRFKDDQRQFLRDQFREFFGNDLPQGLDEPGLMSTYRENLKSRCGLTFAADLAVPHPTHQRTWFHLVVGGKNPAVLELFRRVEARVMGREAAQVRTQAREHREEKKSGQMALALDTGQEDDPWYERENRRGRAEATAKLVALVQQTGGVRFKDVWTSLLESYHVTRRDLAVSVLDAVDRRQVCLKPAGKRRSVRDEDMILPLGSQEEAAEPVDD